jgi:hypothetical protein
MSKETKDFLHGGKMIEISNFVSSEKTVNMPVSGPMRLLFISDLHLFSPDSSKKYIKQVFQELDKPNTYAILLGDIIQGFNPSHASMAAGVPRLDDQMLTAELLLKRYADNGKLIAAVGGTDSHEGWGDKNMTFDVTYFMLRNIKGVDGNNLPILNNGGYLKLKFPTGGEHRIKVLHNPGGGGSAKNMVGAQRARALEIPIDDPSSPDQVVGGHNHSRAMITTELSINAITDKVISQSFASGGTAQGIEPENPNIFLTARGTAPSLKGLPSSILIPVKGNGVIKKDVWGLNSSDKLLQAIRLWDAIESRNLGAETEEMIRENMPINSAKFLENESRVVERTGDNIDIESRSYDVVRWNFDSVVPNIIYFVGGLRYGASSADVNSVNKVMKEVEKNPEAYTMIIRRMVDKNLSSRVERDEYLSKFVKLIQPSGKKNKILSLLLDSSLRENAWKKDIGDIDSDNDIFSSSIITGDFITRKINNLPLIVNNSLVITDFGKKIDYRISVRDKLGGNMSTENPFNGLEAQKKKNRTRIDVAVGGHGLRVGVSQSEKGVVVAPGGFARWAEMGEDNEERFPKGGQSVILYPSQKMMLACATFEEGKDTHRAVFYSEGLKYLPQETQEKFLKMTTDN